MMTPARYNLISIAIRKCSAYCKRGEMPFSSLVRYLEDLHDLGWSRQDIRAVEKAVVRTLGAGSEDQFV